MSAAAVKITLCEPSVRGSHYDEHQFPRSNRPVSVHYLGRDAGWQSNGFSFEEAQGVQTRTAKRFAGRRFATPAFAVNDKMLRKTICEYLVHRAAGHKRWKTALPKGTENDIDKIRWAEGLLAARVPSLERQVDSLCDEYVELRRSGSDPVRLKKVATLIGNLDSTIVFNRQPAAIVASVIYAYFRLGENSVGTAQSVGLHPPAVRQLTRRIWLAAERLGYGERQRVARRSSKVEARDHANHSRGALTKNIVTTARVSA